MLFRSIPPSIADTQFPAIDQLIDEMNALRTNPLVTGPVTQLRILPVNLTACTYGMRSLSGQMFDPTYSELTSFAPNWFAYVTDTINQPKVIAQLAEGLVWDQPIASTLVFMRVCETVSQVNTGNRRRASPFRASVTPP